jgi:hypothetical protein
VKSSVVVFTSVNLAYLSQAVVLRDSLRVQHPDWPLVLVLVDTWPAEIALVEQLELFDDVILAEDLVPDGFLGWVFQHDVVEACTAVKGPALERLLKSFQHVVYLDPDMVVLGSLDPVVENLRRAPVVLTPHLLSPEISGEGVRDNEIGTLLTGTYNLGFLGVSAVADGLVFARWWTDRLFWHCFDEPAKGLFTDQRWMDLAPVFFPALRVLRDPGMNVASWNIATRRIGLNKSGDYEVNGEPLRLFHFTKATTVGPAMTRRYAKGNPHVFELWRWYLAALEEARSHLPAVPWAYGQFANGAPIPGDARRVYRDRYDLRRAFPDPFEDDGQALSFYRWLVEAGWTFPAPSQSGSLG